MSHNTLYSIETSISELSLDDLRSLKETIVDAIKDLEAKERQRKRLANCRRSNRSLYTSSNTG